LLKLVAAPLAALQLRAETAAAIESSWMFIVFA
jgi:hypothetical protein